MEQLELFAKETKVEKVKTSKRLHTWTVQKKEGGRWRTIVDSMGVITFVTLAASIIPPHDGSVLSVFVS